MPFGRWVRAVPRWALSQVLDVIAPPYTSDFVQLFLPILENDSIAGTIKTEGEHDPVTEFIGGFCPGASAAVSPFPPALLPARFLTWRPSSLCWLKLIASLTSSW